MNLIEKQAQFKQWQAGNTIGIDQQICEAGVNNAAERLRRAAEKTFADAGELTRFDQDPIMAEIERRSEDGRSRQALADFADWVLMPKLLKDRDGELLEAGDTNRNTTVENYRRIAEEIGFELVGEFAIDCTKKKYFNSEEWPAIETIYIYARPDGLFLIMDSLGGKPNTADLWCEGFVEKNWDLPYDSASVHNLNPDGAMVQTLKFDAVCALRGRVGELEGLGHIQSPMACLDEGDLRRMFIVSQDYSTQGADQYSREAREALDKLAAARFAVMPPWVKQMIGPAPAPEIRHKADVNYSFRPRQNSGQNLGPT